MAKKRKFRVRSYEERPPYLARLFERYLINVYGSKKKLNEAMDRVRRKLMGEPEKPARKRRRKS